MFTGFLTLKTTLTITITQPPRNTTVTVRSNVILSCDASSSGSQVFFWQAVRNKLNPNLVYFFDGQNYTFSSQLDRFQRHGTFGLSISNVSLFDGTTYKCYFPIDDSSRIANIIVTGKFVVHRFVISLVLLSLFFHNYLLVLLTRHLPSTFFHSLPLGHLHLLVVAINLVSSFMFVVFG